jgi:hypothetical protein
VRVISPTSFILLTVVHQSPPANEPYQLSQSPNTQ